MSRLFARGELKTAILDALGEIEPANGYAIMQALADAIGGAWKPSPGAVYPAILGLEDAGLVVGIDDAGSLTYRLTDVGRQTRRIAEGTLSAVADRARQDPPAPTLGSLVDAFASATVDRAYKLTPVEAAKVERLLDSTHDKLAKMVDKENTDG